MNAVSLPPLEPRTDPRFRYTFADVAMRLVHDGPWYAVMAVVLVLALRGTTTAGETMNGIALILLGRAKPPPAPDKAHLIRGIASAVIVLAVFGALHACAAPAPLNPQPLPPAPAVLGLGL